MRFDLFHVLANRGNKRSWDELLDETRARAEMGDELGFDGFWMGEHHFDREGADQLPNPIMMAADLAARTTDIRFGMCAVGMPLWHPIRLAEDLSMLDHFSKGRVDVAFSRGILRGEIVNLNPEADRSNEEKSRAIFQEHLDIVKSALTDDPFSWKGERYQIPQPELTWNSPAYKDYHGPDGYMTGLVVLPHSVQSPIPMYAVSQQEAGWRLAAHQGLGVITSHPAGKKLRGLNEAYLEECEKVGRPAHVGSMAPAVREFCIAETDAEAREMMEEFVTARFDLIRRVRGLGAWLDIDEDPEDKKLQAMNGFDLMMERDYLFIGSPDSVTERMIRLAREENFGHFILQQGNGATDKVERSLRLMAEEVIPRVKAAVEQEGAA